MSNRKSKINEVNSKEIKSQCLIDYIKSKFIIKKIFDNLQKNILLSLIHHNKKIQNILELDINDYKKYSEIEIDLIPMAHKYGKYINIFNQENFQYYHIFFNESKNEIKKYYFTNSDKVSKIKIIIDYQVKTLVELFKDCVCIESINFKNFNRNNIKNMCRLFCGCSFLKELNLSNFNTYNVTDISGMFFGCSSLKEINLSKFETNKVTDMRGMFWGCSSLKKLDLSNFNTNNVTDMNGMFRGCSSLKELDLSNFNTNNVTDMSNMLWGCSALKELNLSSFNTKNVIDMGNMFQGFSTSFKLNIKEKYKNIKEEAFQ